MATQKRQRQLDRQRYERQQTRRQQEYSRQRYRHQTMAAVAAVIAVIAGFVILAVLVPNPNPVLSTQSSAQPSSDTTSFPVSSDTSAASSAPSTASDGQVICTYTPSGTASKTVNGLPASTAPVITNPVSATLLINQSQLNVDLLTTQAPCTTRSFVFLAQQKFFDTTTCHRITKGTPQNPAGEQGLSVLQCGDPSASGTGGPGYAFNTENRPQGHTSDSEQPVTYPAGTLAMANSGTPDSNGSQFFIVYADSTLPPNYTVFGQIRSGLEHLNALAKNLAPQSDQKPATTITLNSATIYGG